jgi:hypothetical protein
MATHVDTHEETSVASLVGGLMEDARRLFVDQLNLFKVELKHDLQQMGQALIPIVFGIVSMVPATFLFAMGLAHGLTALFPDHVPLWASFLIVGSVVAGVGIGLAFWGKSILANLRPVDTALKGLQENVQWKTKN